MVSYHLKRKDHDAEHQPLDRELAGCCSSWLTGSRPTTTSSFTSRAHFVGSQAYSVEMLRADLARFAFLLGVMNRKVASIRAAAAERVTAR